MQAINSIKSCATNSHPLTELCGGQEANFKTVQRVFELRAIIVEFLHSKNHLLAEYFFDKQFLAKVPYLFCALSMLQFKVEI